jgi:hypothetical protein
MKYLASLAAIVLLMVACTTTQQTTSYKTLFSLEHSTVAAYDSYAALVIRGTLPTNDVAKVSKAFNVFQASALPALDAVQYNTNALAPDALIIEAQDLINLITTIKAKGTL